MTKQIFLVDDSSTIRMSMEQLLTKSGFGVATAGNGQEALQMLKSGTKPDLMITDINMPEMDGISLIGEARKLPGCRFTPILVLTTENQQASRDQAKSLGATGYLVKPVGGEDLVRVIRQVLPGA